MSQPIKLVSEKITVPRLIKMYQNGEKLTMVTAYDYTMARLVDSAGIDMILVGDSLGMVIQGNKDTLPVSIDELIYHTKCVAKGVKKAHIMADMPFMSYQASYEDAVTNAGNLLKAGAESVKLEGGEEMADLVWYLSKIGIPVMGHIGLKPQSVHQMGGYKVQGKSKLEADAIINDAKILEEAGVFSLLLEGVPAQVAQEVAKNVAIPTIGIGSGPSCSGQVLVIYDLLGMNPDFKPRFVKQYVDINTLAKNALGQYVEEVRNGSFPAHEHSTHQTLVMVEETKS